MKLFGAIILAALALSGCISQEATDDAGWKPPTENTATTLGAPEISAAAVQEEAASARSEIVGSAAPDFTLPDKDGNPVTLSGLGGQWVVLYFYPKDDTPGCTVEANDFTGLEERFNRLNARVIGVSADSLASHRSFADKFGISVDLLSDEDKLTIKKYGAWSETSIGGKTQGRIIRTTFLIDPTGVIRHHWPEVIPDGHASRVMQKLEQIQAQN